MTTGPENFSNGDDCLHRLWTRSLELLVVEDAARDIARMTLRRALITLALFNAIRGPERPVDAQDPPMPCDAFVRRSRLLL